MLGTIEIHEPEVKEVTQAGRATAAVLPKSEVTPAADPATGGVAGGVPGGQVSGVIGSNVRSTSNLAAVPKFVPVTPQRMRIHKA